MFPFQKGDLCFQISNNNEQNGNYFGSNSSTSSFCSNPTNKRKLGHHVKPLRNEQLNNNNNNGNDVAKKKMIHREIERQRRLEMATLYSSLRSILPLEYVKGKRSMSDHISEATKYIKDLEKNIKNLGDKKIQLQEKSCFSTKKLNENLEMPQNNTSSSSKNDCNVSIQSFSNVIDIEICKGVSDEDPFPLSSVVKVLNEEGLDVVSVVSTLVNNRCIYAIHSKVEDVKSIDSRQLQWRLNNEIH